MKHVLWLACFRAVPMTAGEWNIRQGHEAGTLPDREGYLLTNVATGREQWQPKEDVDRASALLPDDFSERPKEDRPWLAERALHAQRILELEAELAERSHHYRANGTTDVFARDFIEPHIEALKQRVVELDEAIRCID